MKTPKWIITVLVAAAFAVTGCNKGSDSATVDTATMEKSFKTGDPAAQTSAQKVVSSVKAGDYAGALTELKTLANNAKLTPEQQQAIKDVMAQVQQALTKTATDMKSGAGKAATDLQKSLPK